MALNNVECGFKYSFYNHRNILLNYQGEKKEETRNSLKVSDTLFKMGMKRGLLEPISSDSLSSTTKMFDSSGNDIRITI